MTREDIAKVKAWLERMQINISRAINLSERMSPEDLEESNDLFWALVKYSENVQESAKQLDDINKKIYPALIEFDMETWNNLKGMRDRLAHKFWDIDPHILWSTVTSDFPTLLALLSTIIVIDNPIDAHESFAIEFETVRLLELPATPLKSEAEAGHSLVALVFEPNGKVEVVRIRLLKQGGDHDNSPRV